MLIAVIGVDGSGKSAVSRNIATKLEKDGYPVKLVHVDSYFLFQPVLNLFNKKKSGENKFLTTDKKPFYMKLWPFVVAVDNLARYLYFSLLRLGGYAVVCDRYFYDKLLGFEYFGYTTPWVSKLFLSLTPPANTIFLDVSPETAASRESGDSHSTDFFFKMVDSYRELARDKGFAYINAERSLNEVMGQVMEEVRNG